MSLWDIQIEINEKVLDMFEMLTDFVVSTKARLDAIEIILIISVAWLVILTGWCYLNSRQHAKEDK